jgi:hypothetical protein
MPQILSYIHANNANGTSTNATAASNAENMITKEAREATIAAASIIEREGASVDDEKQMFYEAFKMSLILALLSFTHVPAVVMEAMVVVMHGTIWKSLLGGNLPWMNTEIPGKILRQHLI